MESYVLFYTLLSLLPLPVTPKVCKSGLKPRVLCISTASVDWSEVYIYERKYKSIFSRLVSSELAFALENISGTTHKSFDLGIF